MQDVGKPKAVVAAQRVQERVAGVTVTAHHCRIEDMPLSFYEEFTVIVLGLDSLEARRYMNGVACSLLRKHAAACSTSSFVLAFPCRHRWNGPQALQPCDLSATGSCLLDEHMLFAACCFMSVGKVTMSAAARPPPQDSPV